MMLSLDRLLVLVATFFICLVTNPKPVLEQYNNDGYNYGYTPQQEQCVISTGDPSMGVLPVNIDAQCCYETGALSNAEFSNQFDSCNAVITSHENEEDQCNEDKTECTIDYHDYSCDDDLMQLCKARGGRVLESSTELTCSYYDVALTHRVLNKPTCMGASCTQEDVYAMYQAIIAEIERSVPGADCKVTTLDDTVTVDGQTISYYHESENDESTNYGAIIGICVAIAAVIVILAVGVVISITRRSNRRTQPPQLSQQMPPEAYPTIPHSLSTINESEKKMSSSSPYSHPGGRVLEMEMAPVV